MIIEWQLSKFYNNKLFFQYHKQPILEKDLHCSWLHHKNPYLRIGPFKFEEKHKDPEVGLLHDFVSLNETSQIKIKAAGKMKSTPYR